MLKSFLKNYAKNIKHVFSCLGVFFLFFSVAMAALLKGLFQIIVYVVQGLQGVIDPLADNISLYLDAIVSQAANDLSNGRLEMTEEYTNSLFVNCASDAFNKTAEQATKLVEDAANQASGYFVIFFITLIIGVIVSFILTRFWVRGTMVKGKFFQRVLLSIPYLLLIFGLPALAILTGGFLEVILLLLTLVLAIVGALVIPYIIHRKENITFKQVVNVKNSLMLILSELICIVITIAIIWLAFLFQPIIALILAVPLIAVGATVTGANAENYIIGLINENNNQAKPITELEAQE